jgi:hypothetical protein
MVLVPLLVSAVLLFVRVGRDYHPLSDWALTEMRTSDVGRQPVLLGLYSRDGWSHPGPLSFYLYAIPYRLLGSMSIGIWLAALGINAVAMTGIAVVARRLGGTALLLCTMLGIALVVRGLGADYVRNPWNLYVTVLPYGLMLLLTWSMLAGRVWALPVGAVLTTFLAQAHVQYAALAIPLLVVGAGALVVQCIRARDPAPRQLAMAGGVSVALLVVLWLPTLYQQATRHPGNLTVAWKWFRNPQNGPHSLLDGVHIMDAQFGFQPEWLGTRRLGLPYTGETPFLFHAPIPWLLILPAAATFLAWRRRDGNALRFAAVIWLSFLIGVVAIRSTAGTMYAYRLQWTWIIGMLALVLVAWTGWKELERRGAARYLTPIAVVAIAALMVVNIVSVLRADDPQAPLSNVLAQVTDGTKRALPPGSGNVVVDPGDPFFTSGLLLALERAGVPARAPGPDSAHLYGDGSRRIQGAGPVRAHVFVALDGDVDKLLHSPAVKLLSYWGTVPIARREEIAGDIQRRQQAIDEDFLAGRISAQQQAVEKQLATKLMPSVHGTPITAVGVFMKHQ